MSACKHRGIYANRAAAETALTRIKGRHIHIVECGECGAFLIRRDRSVLRNECRLRDYWSALGMSSRPGHENDTPEEYARFLTESGDK